MSAIRPGVLSLATIVLIASMAAAVADSARRAVVPDEYEIVELGTLGGLTSNALDLNEQGQVVGAADMPGGLRHAYLWDDGVMTDLGTLPPIDQTESKGINNLSQVVGMASNSGNISSAFIWEDGVIAELGDPTMRKTAYAINDAGQVVGVARIPPPVSFDHAFLFEDDVLTDLGTLGGTRNQAWDINELGQVVGESYTGVANHPFLWEDGVMIDLGTLGGEGGRAYGINDLGQVVGWAQTTPGEWRYTAYLWEDGVMTDIGALGGFEISSAEDINNHGQIVGEPGFLYDPVEGMIDLLDRLPFGSGWTEVNPHAINDAGQIAGWGYHNGPARGFLMTPVPPPIPAVSNFGAAVLIVLFIAVGSAFALRAKRPRADRPE